MHSFYELFQAVNIFGVAAVDFVTHFLRQVEFLEEGVVLVRLPVIVAKRPPAFVGGPQDFILITNQKFAGVFAVASPYD